jgi:carbon storage regulator CsrA
VLVLTRKLQQQIKIGDQITVTILRVKGQTVRVGIDAPRAVRVVRGELPRDAATANDDAPIVEQSALVAEGESAIADSANVDAPTRSSPPAEDVSFSPQPPVATLPPSTRLPQRKRFNRSSGPPLRVAMPAGSSTLAK